MSCRGRLTKFHPSTSSGSFGRLYAFKQKLSVPVRSTLLDDFELKYQTEKQQKVQLKTLSIYKVLQKAIMKQNESSIIN